VHKDTKIGWLLNVKCDYLHSDLLQRLLPVHRTDCQNMRLAGRVKSAGSRAIPDIHPIWAITNADPLCRRISRSWGCAKNVGGVGTHVVGDYPGLMIQALCGEGELGDLQCGDWERGVARSSRKEARGWQC
jgi:hypothetical protein